MKRFYVIVFLLIAAAPCTRAWALLMSCKADKRKVARRNKCSASARRQNQSRRTVVYPRGIARRQLEQAVVVGTKVAVPAARK